MKNLYILQTDQPSRLHYYFELNKRYVLSKKPLNWRTASHIYITSDIEIKKSDWVLNSWNEIHKVTKNDKSKSYKNTCRKIILTTDPTLISDGVQAIDDEFLEWFVKNPTCEHVEYVGDNCYYEIIIPQEESKQEILPEFKLSKDIFNKLSCLSSKDLPQEFSKLIDENFDELFSEGPKQEKKPHSFCETPEEKCTMNYCDDNGCQNRKRHLVEPHEQETLEAEEICFKKASPLVERKSDYIFGFRDGANYMAERMYSRQDIIDFVYFINDRHFNKYTVDTDEVDLFIEQLKNK